MEEEVKIQETTGMVVNESMKADLLSSAKWAKFLCIVGCIGVAFMIIAALAVFAFSSKFSAIPGMGQVQGMIGIVYLITAALMIYPLIKGFQFANGTKAACLTGSETELARGFAGMRCYLQFIGILTIIVLIIYALALIGIFAVAGIAASQL
jgi:hypothetical protein